MHNFVGTHDVPLLALIQLTREGQTQESGTVISQSDRILWLVSNFTIFKEKGADEVAHAMEDMSNRKLVPLASRHGEGLKEGDYINMHFDKKFATITQGETRSNIDANTPPPIKKKRKSKKKDEDTTNEKPGTESKDS